ncbi:MAG: N-acetylmuramoyl-L-alanine amidase [Gemmatimonadaceae bacterium]|nr:N-acetylmuramoyl-L-alanine amidase [Gemmatimonadaceae bacterium]NUQ94906.1 N-acetylmuramoyl-L-alanine amidase [Gemmatimonadaceae bacterium]NUR35258.1 N-acetylmuramoyl-L-alanine amidase [Gemmatimonadaceae bacterium]NUS97853.1 N-acetylmuramoyl-L-alanine amidase [Gemmatimonadaceae bacterium]
MTHLSLSTTLALSAVLLSHAALGQSTAHRPTIVIDPGHPSEVSDGATVQHGISEVRASWLVARRLETLLRARGYRVVLTKPAERRMVTNVDRAEVGNRERAALVVRLHCDASSDSGYAIYYPDRLGTAHGRTGPDTSVMRRSREAAESLHVAVAARIGTRLKDGGVRGDSRTFVGGKQGALTGSIFSEVPVALVEMVTLSNRHDAAFIRDPAGQRLMARAIAEGVERYVPVEPSSSSR